MYSESYPDLHLLSEWEGGETLETLRTQAKPLQFLANQFWYKYNKS